MVVVEEDWRLLTITAFGKPSKVWEVGGGLCNANHAQGDCSKRERGCSRGDHSVEGEFEKKRNKELGPGRAAWAEIGRVFKLS